MKKVLLIILFNSIIFANTISIAIASNMSYVIKPLVKEFNKKYKDIQIQITQASSGKLTAQIAHFAPYNIFISANMQYPEFLYKKHFVKKPPVVFAKGYLVLFSKEKRDFSKGLSLLLEKSIQTIAIANPKTAPYGTAAREVLLNSKLYAKLKSKFIYAQSISSALTYSLKVADVGFIAKSALFAPNMKKYVKNSNWIDIDMSLYKPIKQGIVVVKETKETSLFYNFLFSKKAKKILQQYGYNLN